MKKFSHLVLFATAFACLSPVALQSAEKADKDAAEEGDDLSAFGKEMADLWGEKLCVAEQTSKYEERVISVACNAEYTTLERDKVLDYLFKKGFTFRGESYDIKGTTGHYWYKFERKDGSRIKLLYVRLHISSQGPLWGSTKPPSRIAVFIDNLATADELTAWQTLGVPVTFGLKPAEGAKDLATQIDEYKQEYWLTLELNPGAFSEPDQAASLKEILDQDLIAPYIKTSLEQAGDVAGVQIRDLNNISTTVASARAVFAAIKAEGKTNVLLPARYNKALTTTANVMGMNSHRVTYDMAPMCSKAPGKIWSFLRSKAGQGGVIARFPASYKRCAHTLSRSLKHDGKVEFKPLSSIFGRKDSAAEKEK